MRSVMKGGVALLLLVLLAGVLTLTPVGAHMNENVNHVWKHIKGLADDRYLQQADADKRYPRKLWAVVGYDSEPEFHPIVLRGKGVVSVEASDVTSTPANPFDDAAVVTFNRNVGRCAYLASLSEEDLNAGTVMTANNAGNGNTNQVTVMGFASDGGRESRGFSLAVIC